MNSNFIRTGTAVIAGATLVAAISGGARAGTFNVSTTITPSCTITDAGPGNLTPEYAPTTDTGTGASTTLDTFCTGPNPTVVFTDAYASNDTQFAMSNGAGAYLFYQISPNVNCNGTPGDVPINENTVQDLIGGTQSFPICAAVIAGGGLNVGAPAGAYQDTVTYTLTP